MAIVAGVDEAGRGPWAGPVVVAAVILPAVWDLPYLNDSKKLTEKRRAILFEQITQHAQALAWQFVQVPMIDRINILRATLLGMQRAVTKLALQPECVLIDGRDTPVLPMPAHAIIGGDAREPAIAAASIVAKVMRDRYMVRLDARYPEYGFAAHKGYGTAKHHSALRNHGPLIHHRKSYAPVRKVLQDNGLVESV